MKPKFNLLDTVYHCTPESPSGVVIDIAYYYATNHFEYRVAFSADVVSIWYSEHELSKQKKFI